MRTALLGALGELLRALSRHPDQLSGVTEAEAEFEEPAERLPALAGGQLVRCLGAFLGGTCGLYGFAGARWQANVVHELAGIGLVQVQHRLQGFPDPLPRLLDGAALGMATGHSSDAGAASRRASGCASVSIGGACPDFRRWRPPPRGACDGKTSTAPPGTR